MTSMNSLAAAGLVFVAAPAWAGVSLVGGQPLQYNHAYPCKGERIVVVRCRDDDDSSYCQIVYPDRPFVNGSQVAPVEMRGDVVAKLNACSQVATAAAQASAPPDAKAPAKATGSYARTGKPPGVETKASWWLLDYDEKYATFYTKAGLRRTGATADGWFTMVYAELKQAPGSPLNGAQFLQMHYLADCKTGATRLAEAAYWDEDGRLLDGAFITPDQSPFTPPGKGSVNDEELKLMCGEAQRPINDKPMEVDGLGLPFIYSGLRKLDEADRRE